jgi:hypothetical protein
MTEVVTGHVWHLGTAVWCGKRREAYFVRCVHDGIRAAVIASITTHPKAVLLFPTESVTHKWGTATSNPLIALEAAISLTPAGLTFDSSIVESRLVESGPVNAPAKRPHPRRAIRTANIEKLTRALVTHLRRARDNAYSAVELNRPPELLPRPTQQELADRCGLSESDVSRCLNDDNARELQLYWETALHLDQVMKFHSTAREDPADE